MKFYKIMVKESLQQKLNRLLKTEDVVNFTFKKKNGEIRHARGTKKVDKIESIDIWISITRKKNKWITS